MKKTLFFAEKPSVGREYKDMLEQCESESFTKHDGYFESENYFITWGFGHLISLADPSEYGWGEWSLNNLPMLPEQWKYIIKDDPGAKKQYKTIVDLIKKSNVVVNGADPDREGELIFRLIVHMSGNSSITQQRFWNRSMTMKDLLAAWKGRKSGQEYNNLYSAANCRQRADWLVGMNLSRAYAIKSGVKGISVGRVQTPTLAMIVNRDREIENWTRAFFSELHINWNSMDLTYVGNNPDSKSTIEFVEDAEKLYVENLAKDLTGQIACVYSLNTSTKTQHAPLMFNLADLQKEANKRHKLTADQTLQAAQALYEKKLLSYPRTDCNYLTEDMYDECMDLLLKVISSEQKQHLNSELPKSFNSKKVTAHTALIPVAIPGSSPAGNEALIYSLVLERFIFAFGRSKKISVTSLLVRVGEHFFSLTNNFTTDPGFDLLFQTEKEEKNVSFPNYINSSTTGKIDDARIVEKERTKPKYYTESTLLSAMENCSKTIADESLRGALKEAEGIGTPATRSTIIEGLKKRGYIVEQKNNLISTDKGRSLIDVVSPEVASPELTAVWESMLSDIENGSIKWSVFYEQICSFTKEVVNSVVSAESESIKITSTHNQLIKCPKCLEQQLMINKGGAFCKNDSCSFKLFKTQFGKNLSESAFNKLLTKRSSGKQKLKNKAGKEYTAEIIMDDAFNITLKF